MILGHGVDIAEVKRFEKWVRDDTILRRFFNENEIVENSSELTSRRISALCQHYAARFAAKEAFAKALGTGVAGFELKDVYIKNDDKGKPVLFVENCALERLTEIHGKCSIHVSLSHEKEYAVASVIIEGGN